MNKIEKPAEMQAIHCPNIRKDAHYIPKINQQDSLSRKARVLSSVVHEYTHCLQRAKDNSYPELKYITDGNLLSAGCLNNFAGITFSRIEQLKANLYNIQAFKENSSSGEEALYKTFGCNNQVEFKRFIKKYMPCRNSP